MELLVPDLGEVGLVEYRALAGDVGGPDGFLLLDEQPALVGGPLEHLVLGHLEHVLVVLLRDRLDLVVFDRLPPGVGLPDQPVGAEEVQHVVQGVEYELVVDVLALHGILVRGVALLVSRSEVEYLQPSRNLDVELGVEDRLLLTNILAQRARDALLVDVEVVQPLLWGEPQGLVDPREEDLLVVVVYSNKRTLNSAPLIAETTRSRYVAMYSLSAKGLPWGAGGEACPGGRFSNNPQHRRKATYRTPAPLSPPSGSKASPAPRR